MTPDYGAAQCVTARLRLITNARAFAIVGTRQSLSTGRQGDRHGKGSDAQQQGKEETEGRQEPQKGRRRAGQSVRVREDPGRPEPEQQEELTPGASSSAVASSFETRASARSLGSEP